MWRLAFIVKWIADTVETCVYMGVFQKELTEEGKLTLNVGGTIVLGTLTE